MNEVSFKQLIEIINNSLNLVPGIHKLSNTLFNNKIEEKLLKTQGINYRIEKKNIYVFEIYIILIKDTNILDVLQKAQKKLQYDLSLIKLLMDKSFTLNFYVEDIH